MDRLVQLDLWLTRAAAALAALAVIAMMLVVAADAFFRQVLDLRMPFVSVIVAKYFMVAIAFLPLALAEAQDRHISVDLVYGKLTPALQRWAALLVHGLAAVTCACLTWTMWDEALRRFGSGTVAVEDGVSMPIWQGYFLLPVGFALLTLTYLLRIALALLGRAAARTPLIDDPADIQEEAQR